MYPCLRVEIPEIKEHFLGSIPPGISPPASVKTANVQVHGNLGSLQTAESYHEAKLAAELAIGLLPQRRGTYPGSIQARDAVKYERLRKIPHQGLAHASIRPSE
ncbi:MAG TPA: hypothetical protein VGF67_01855 [Ktedonobacteraceae bacterium]|jgi:hypothetical protein